MNKKLIAVALAALPVAAMADVTIYGTLAGGLEHNTVTNGVSTNAVQDYTSLIGFKGSEDLGNGLKTIWQIESRLHLDGTGSKDTVASRQTWLGLDAGNIGKVRFGYINSPLDDAQNLDPTLSNENMTSGATATGANGMGLYGTGARQKNAIRYDSATFAGFNGSAMYYFGENKTTSGMSASDGYGLSLNYGISDFSFRYAYQHDSNSNGVTTSNPQGANINYFEAQYNPGALNVIVGYQNANGYNWASGGAATVDGDGTTIVNPNLKSTSAGLLVSYTIGAFTPRVQYMKGWDQKNGNTTVAQSGYHQYILSLDYALSKRTTAQVAYGQASLDANNSANTNNAGQTTKISTVSLGLAHSF